jgi:hypothetical protein
LVPPTVQTARVVEVKVTGLPEAPPVAVAVPVPPTASVGADPKLMLCDPNVVVVVVATVDVVVVVVVVVDVTTGGTP